MRSPPGATGAPHILQAPSAAMDARPMHPVRWLSADLPRTVCVAGPETSFAEEALPEELLLVAGAAPERRAQFSAARAAARGALHELQVAPAALLRTPIGSVSWPVGVVGSLAHCAGQVVAAVTRQDDWQGIGVDVEPNAQLPADAGSIVLTPADVREWAGAAGGRVGPAGPYWSRLVFCAKECVHKCLHPLRDVWLEFDEVAIRIDAASGAFQVLPQSRAARAGCEGLRLEGRWQLRAGFVLAILAAA